MSQIIIIIIIIIVVVCLWKNFWLVCTCRFCLEHNVEVSRSHHAYDCQLINNNFLHMWVCS
jgi:hypothetical protein